MTPDSDYIVNALNQYTSITQGGVPYTPTYDDNGSLTSDGVWTFTYNVENQLTRAEKTGIDANYEYDPYGRRSKKSGTGVVTEVYLTNGANEIADYDGSGTVLRRYIHGPGIDEPVAMTTGTGFTTIEYYHADYLGSIVAMSDNTGALSEQYRYSPYGEVDDTSGNPFRYTGRRLDAETGLYYYRARYYSATLGRFLQVDPIGYGDGLNTQAYVGNDPINATDPSGTSRLVDNATILFFFDDGSGGGSSSRVPRDVCPPGTPQGLECWRVPWPGGYLKPGAQARVNNGILENSKGSGRSNGGGGRSGSNNDSKAAACEDATAKLQDIDDRLQGALSALATFQEAKFTGLSRAEALKFAGRGAAKVADSIANVFGRVGNMVDIVPGSVRAARSEQPLAAFLGLAANQGLQFTISAAGGKVGFIGGKSVSKNPWVVGGLAALGVLGGAGLADTVALTPAEELAVGQAILALIDNNC